MLDYCAIAQVEGFLPRLMMLDADQHELLAEVAALYYEEALTQNEIAARLGLSRVKIYRLLKQARDEQVVTILIDWPIKREPRLERALCATFGLHDALVMQALSADDGMGLHQLGQLAARYLEQVLQDGTTLTVCLGRSTYETINAIRPGFRAHVRVAPALGSMPFALPRAGQRGAGPAVGPEAGRRCLRSLRPGHGRQRRRCRGAAQSA